ncbi:ABC transporter permease [Fredinandcohnia sp. QZ13]|uniref:ABC transporter permease n=1 Tax=Fredinandcohnia sp. QZ13 TaxID=3073144 RepID=UPI0028535CF5|nr:ABC transporter permease [Fredinandcohnia sp. QZ13]MDR4888093.1 ABC transporter permease [Fredinandcohnia sp. QZ13]
MRTIALIKRIFQQLLRDKRTLALLFVAPLLVLSLMYVMFNGDSVEPTLGVVDVDEKVVTALKEVDIQIEEFNQSSNPKQTILDYKLDGLLAMEDNQVILTVTNSDPTSAKALQMKVNQVFAAQAQEKLAKQIPAIENLPKVDLEINYVYGNSDTLFFDVLSPILIGYFVFFFVFLISGIGLLKERTSGTLERLMATPIRRGEIVTAYLVGFGIFAIIQTVIVVFFTIHVLDVVLVGSIWNVILINLLLALVALSLGILLSAFAASEFQMIQFIPIVIIPQIFFSGIFPLEGMADWLQAIAKVMPIYYAADALKGVMYQGLGFADVSLDLLALVIFATVFIILNVFALKKYRAL